MFYLINISQNAAMISTWMYNDDFSTFNMFYKHLPFAPQFASWDFPCIRTNACGKWNEETGNGKHLKHKYVTSKLLYISTVNLLNAYEPCNNYNNQQKQTLSNCNKYFNSLLHVLLIPDIGLFFWLLHSPLVSIANFKKKWSCDDTHLLAIVCNTDVANSSKAASLRQRLSKRWILHLSLVKPPL